MWSSGTKRLWPLRSGQASGLSAERLELGRRRVPAWALWLGGTAGLAAAIWICDMGAGIRIGDSNWFLYLLDRVAHGDALYSDRFYGVTPLAVWAGLPGVLLIGPQAAVVKGLNALASAAAATLAAYTARRLGVGRAGQALVLLASVVYTLLPSHTPYKLMAAAAQVGAMAAMAAWIAAGRERSGDAQLLLAGTAIGIAAATKQTVGALTLAACLLVLWLAPRKTELRSRFGQTGLLLVPAILIPALALVPVAIAGDLGDFWRYAIIKGPYLDRGSTSYLYGFRTVFDLWGFPPAYLHVFLYHLGDFAAPLALLGLVLTIRRTGPWVLLAGFTAAAIVSTYPRPQLVAAVPVFAVALAWSLHQLTGDRIRSGPAKLALGATALLMVATGYATLLRPAVHGIREGYVVGGIEHHAGVLVDPDLARAAGELGGELARADRGENRTFVLTTDAGLLYLVSDVIDPVRDDVPFASAFRSGDRRELKQMMASGEIARVCLGSFKTFGKLRPAGIERYVRSRLIMGERVGPSADTAFGDLGCRIYRSPAAG